MRSIAFRTVAIHTAECAARVGHLELGRRLPLGVRPEDAALLQADGDSMRGTVNHGDMMLINTADRRPRDGRVFVVDGTLNLDPLVDALSARRVLGYGVGEDLKRLPSRDWNVDDLQRRFPRHKAPSLQRVVAEVLREYVDKSLQRSDWDSRPLSSEQLRYAALDAAVLLRVEERLSSEASSAV